MSYEAIVFLEYRVFLLFMKKKIIELIKDETLKFEKFDIY